LLTSAAAAPPGVGPATAVRGFATGPRRELFPVRAVVASLNHPYWHAEHGYPDAAQAFWDKTAWENQLRGVVRCGYAGLQRHVRLVYDQERFTTGWAAEL
jgi:hypothetical protein